MNNIIFKEPLKHISHLLISPPLKESFDQTGSIYFTAHLITKTRISVSVHSGKSLFLTNLEIKGFQLATVNKGYSMIFGYQGLSYYFKKTKNQDKERFREYVTAVFEKIKEECGIEYNKDVYIFTDVYAAD